MKYTYPALTAARHKSYMIASERPHSPSDKKMTTGVLKSQSINFVLVFSHNLTSVRSIVAPIPYERCQGPCRSPCRRTSCYVQLNSPLVHLVCLCYHFPRGPSHCSQKTPVTSLGNIPRGHDRTEQCYMNLAGHQTMLLALLRPLLSSRKHTTPTEPLHNGYHGEMTLFGSSGCWIGAYGQWNT